MHRLSVFSWLLAAVLVVSSLSACRSSESTQTDAGDSSSSILKLTGETMGTRWSVQLRLPGGTPDRQRLAGIEQAILAELLRINSLMSTWDPESELSRFNRSSSTEPQSLHADTLKVIDTALAVGHLTDGRYDITLAPAIDLWGFGAGGVPASPSDEQVDQALAVSGSRYLVRSGSLLRKRQPQVRLDLSSLAKGYAVDQLGVVLEQSGVTDYLTEIGGELRARGYRAPGVAWRVGIETPQGQVNEGIALMDTHVASSGSYRNYREENGRRLSHIIDGRTGRPIDHALVAVTVVHDSTMLADAWATALLVVGEKDAQALAERLGLAVQLTVRVTDGFTVYRTPEFSALMLESS